MIIGDRIRQRLEEIGNTQAQLARAIGVSPQAVSKMILGGTTDSPKLFQIARFLETTPEYLMGESSDPGVPGTADNRMPFHGSAPDEPGQLLPRGKVGQTPARKQLDEDIVEIAEIDLRFGLGGAFMDQEIVEHQARTRPFARGWVRMITSSPVSQLYWARGVGDSMEPKISDGDVILIDRSQTDPSFGDLYWAISYGQTGMIKRLRPMPDGSVKILSDNPNVPPEVAYDGELNVFGRVVAVVKRV